MIAKYFAAAVGSWVIWSLLVSTVLAQPCPAFSCSSQMTNLNTLRQANKIIRGRLSSSRYVVVVPNRNDETLNSVRRCVGDAFLSQARRGWYVHAGAFPNRACAESLSNTLRSAGLDARVAYFR